MKLVAVAEPSPIGYGKGAGAGQGRHELDQAIHDIMRRRLDDALASAPGDVTVEGTLVDGDPAKSLGQIGVEDGGVLVVGSRGYGTLRRVLLGSVSTELTRTAPCPVIVHPRSAKADESTMIGEQASSTA